LSYVKCRNNTHNAKKSKLIRKKKEEQEVIQGKTIKKELKQIERYLKKFTK
jgi:hypothetical protein